MIYFTIVAHLLRQPLKCDNLGGNNPIPKKHASVKIHNGYVAIFKFHVDLTFEWVEKSQASDKGCATSEDN